jgi:hypothetical protein
MYESSGPNFIYSRVILDVLVENGYMIWRGISILVFTKSSSTQIYRLHHPPWCRHFLFL